MKNKVLFAILCSIAVSSCTMETFYASKERREHAKNEITTAPDWEVDAAIYTSKPTPNLVPVKKLEGPSWLNSNLAHPVQISDLPFDMAVDAILEGTNVVPHFDYDIKMDLPVSLEHSGSIRGALDKLSARTNFEYLPKMNVIEWKAYVTKTFTLPIAGGEYSYMIGKTDQGSGGNGSPGGGGSGGMQNTIDTSAFDVDLKQYSNTQAEGLDYFADSEAAVLSIVGNFGTVVPARSSSTILVKTTPDRMRTVETYMQNILDELTSQVLLEVKVIQVTSNSGSDAGVNWATVKNQTRSSLEFMGDTAASMFTNSIPIGFSGRRDTGSGSVEVLLSALEQQGEVSFITEQRVLTSSGKLAELELADIQGYLAQSQVTNTSDIGSSQQLVPGIIQSGYTLYSYAKIFGDRVAMVISNRSSDLAPFEKVGSEDNFIQIPSMKSNRLNVHQIVRDGTTVVAAAIRREETSSEKKSPISARFLPSYSGSEVKITDIYVLVTPRIIRDI